MCLRQKTSKSQGRRRNIFILYFPTQSYICQIEELHLAMHEFCHAGRMLQVFRCTYNYRGFGLLSDLTIRLQKKSVLKQKGGRGMQSHNPSHCLGPSSSSTISVALTLITTWGDDVTGSPRPPGR